MRKSEFAVLVLIGVLVFLCMRVCSYRSRISELEEAVTVAESEATEAEVRYEREARAAEKMRKKYEAERRALEEKIAELSVAKATLEQRYRKLKAEITKVRDDELVSRIALFVGEGNVWKTRRAFCLSRKGAERSLSIFYDYQMLVEKVDILLGTLEAERRVSKSYREELENSLHLLSLCNEKAVRWRRAYEASGELIDELQRIRLKERWIDRGGGFLLGFVVAVSVYLALR